jgi:hypothetical protein
MNYPEAELQGIKFLNKNKYVIPHRLRWMITMLATYIPFFIKNAWLIIFVGCA